jgi:hypothetical protein
VPDGIELPHDIFVALQSQPGVKLPPRPTPVDGRPHGEDPELEAADFLGRTRLWKDGRMKLVKVTVVQAGGILFEAEAATAKAERFLVETAGADLVIFPGAFIGGYPKWHDFSARAASRTAEGRKTFRRYCEGRIDIPGSATERLGEAARTVRAWLVIGVIARDQGALYCTTLFLSPDGCLAGKHAS